MEWAFIPWILSLLFLLLICWLTFLFSKKNNYPYTVILVLVWMLLIPISKISLFSFIDDFKLTPDILFFVFLPILLFEAAYNINYKQLIKNWKSITALAIFWLILSTFIIATTMFYLLPLFWFNIPFLVCLLFWSLISATDPVAVLSLFKSVWAPRRLTLIFEWESLFNDWTSLALFLVILWIIFEWNINSWVILWWVWLFTSMIVWWIIFWTLIWILFSKIIWYIKNNKEIEITFTIVLAHLTFVLSEVITHKLHIPISWVIATTITWVIIWNYGRYKISPKVEEYMETFWWFFWFISNSLVFIMMWLILSYVYIDFSIFIIPIFFVIILVMIARAISVYLPIWIINIFKIEENIPINWQHLLAWWSLRWALALMMVLMIPWKWDKNFDKILNFQEYVWWNYDFSIKDFIMIITIWCIIFTLFIKATTIPYLMKKMRINELDDLEKFEHEELKIISYYKTMIKINNYFDKDYINKSKYESLKKYYENNLKKSTDFLIEFLNKKEIKSSNLVKKAISLHSLWIEKQYLKELFIYNEIDESNFRYILRKINRQIERIESWSDLLSNIADIWSKDYNFLEKFILKYDKECTSNNNVYIRSRARFVITKKVIRELIKMKEINFCFWNESFDEVIELYKVFNKKAENIKKDILSKDTKTIEKLEEKLFSKSLLKIEINVVNDLFKKEIITPKLYIAFIEEIEENIYKDLKA